MEFQHLDDKLELLSKQDTYNNVWVSYFLLRYILYDRRQYTNLMSWILKCVVLGDHCKEFFHQITSLRNRDTLRHLWIPNYFWLKNTKIKMISKYWVTFYVFSLQETNCSTLGKYCKEMCYQSASPSNHDTLRYLWIPNYFWLKNTKIVW